MTEPADVSNWREVCQRGRGPGCFTHAKQATVDEDCELCHDAVEAERNRLARFVVALEGELFYADEKAFFVRLWEDSADGE